MHISRFIFSIIIISLLHSILVYCEKSTDTVNIEHITKIEMNLISYTELPAEFDSTFYQHNSDWDTPFDTTAADSLSKLLADSAGLITDMWFPHSTFKGGIPIRAGTEVIIKLSLRDISIYEFGFESYTGFPFVCVDTWRHYKFIK